MHAFLTNAGYVAGDRLLHQIGGIIGRLVRGEDLAARFRGDKFVVAVADGYRAVTAALKSAVTSFRPGDTAEALIARARAEARLA